MPAMSQNPGNHFATHKSWEQRGNIPGLPQKEFTALLLGNHLEDPQMEMEPPQGSEGDWGRLGDSQAWAESLSQTLLPPDQLEPKGGNPKSCQPGQQTLAGTSSLSSGDPPKCGLTWPTPGRVSQPPSNSSVASKAFPHQILPTSHEPRPRPGPPKAGLSQRVYL